jgi:hypothetical protein
MMGRLFDCRKDPRAVLAFFPVVAISTNFSTNKIQYKANKNIQ